jgi:hypothetical protein
MNKNPLLFIVDETNDFLRYAGVIKALNGYNEQIVVISPQPLTTVLSVSMMPNNANYNRYTQYVLPSSDKASDYVGIGDALYQTVVDWNVFKTDIKPNALTEFSAFRSGDVSFAFAWEQINPSSKCVTYKGVFGVDSPLPTTLQVVGDYYECEDVSFSVVSGDNIYAFSTGMLIYWNGTRWIKDRLLTLGSTTSVNLSIEPSHSVGGEFDDDDTLEVEGIVAQVVINQNDISALEQKDIDILSGVEPFTEITLKDGSNNQTSITYATKIADDLELDRLELDKADITYVDNQDNALGVRIDGLDVRLTEVEGDISAINLHEALIDGRLDNLEANDILIEADIANLEDGTTVIPIYELKANKGQANGYVPLNGGSLIDSVYLPSYVDDVLEYPTYADLPLVGESGKLYVVVTDELTGNDASTYRWSGSAYTLIHDQLSSAEVKVLYEANADTNAFTDAEKTKLLSLLNGSNYYNKTEIDALLDQLKAVYGWEDSDLGSFDNADTPQPTFAYSLLSDYDLVIATWKDNDTTPVETYTVIFKPSDLPLGHCVRTQIRNSPTMLGCLNHTSEGTITVGVVNTSNVLQASEDATVFLTGVKLTPLSATKVLYDGTSSGLVAENVQDAIDEVENRVEGVEGKILEVNAVAINHETRIDAIEELTRKSDSTVASVDDDGLGIVHLGKDVSETPIKIKVDGLLLDAPQLVTNGDFSDGTTGWNSLFSNSIVITGVLSNTGDGSNVSPRIFQLDNAIINEKYYYNSKLRVTNALSTQIRIGTGNSQITISQSNPVQNIWYTLSGIGSSTATTSLVNIVHTYANTTNANGAVMEVDYAYTFNISTLITNKQYSPIYNTTFDLMSDAEIKIQMDTWVQDGTLPNDIMSVDMDKRVKGVGKNLFDGVVKSGVNVTATYISPTEFELRRLGTNAYIDNHFNTKFKPNTQYTFSGSHIQTVSGENLRLAIVYTDGTVTNFGAPPTTVATFTLTSTAGKSISYISNVYSGSATGKTIYTNLQIEANTTATTYEPYRSTSMYLDSNEKVGYSLPNSVKDTIEFRNGRAYHVQRVKLDTTVVKNATFTSPFNLTNVRAFNVDLSTSLDYAIPNNNSTLSGVYLKIADINIPVKLESSFSVDEEGVYITIATKLLTIKILKSKLSGSATVTDFHNYIQANDVLFYYQLATPIETEISVIGNALAHPRGTFYIEDVVRRSGVYGTDMPADKAIKQLDNIYKLNDDGSSTKLAVSDATVAGDGFSFTHTGLTEGDFVWFDYYYQGDNIKGLTTIYYYDDLMVVAGSGTTASKVYKIVPTVVDENIVWTKVEV